MARKQSAVTLGTKQTARVASKRVIKQAVKQVAPNNPLVAGILVAGLGAAVTYFLGKYK